jgi:hypothetical protein
VHDRRLRFVVNPREQRLVVAEMRPEAEICELSGYFSLGTCLPLLPCGATRFYRRSVPCGGP